MTYSDGLRSESGTVTILVVGLSTALLMVAGLLFDGGQILAARREMFAVADNAARAGAQAIDLGALRAGAPAQLESAAAEAAARGYLDRLGHDGSVRVTGDEVAVTVSTTVDLALLSAVGLEARTVTGTGHARIVQGITGPEG